jgi:hypothetical protein
MKTTFIATLLLTAVNLHFATPARAAEDYVAHEWGTFTSVQGADGVQLEWNPFITSELPTFVYDAYKQNNAPPRVSWIKSTLRTLQRMETPVIYFYADGERTVDVSVRFPQGNVTEWYPQIRALPPAKTNGVSRGAPREIHWDRVRVLPPPVIATADKPLPFDKSGSHYYAARETDANLLSVTPRAGEREEIEKFLFYRGVGDFRAPLIASLKDDGDTVEMRNNSAEPLRNLFTYTVRNGQGKFLYVESLLSGETKTVRLADAKQTLPLSDLRREIAKEMQVALMKEGLYDREASAMVKTWDDSWFAETGLRVLYTLSREWTDRTLPLTLNPAPKSLARVMVGRAELIPPGIERQLADHITRYSAADPASRPYIVEATRRLDLGRFAQPAFLRVTSGNRDPLFKKSSVELMQLVSKSPTAAKPLASTR